MTQALGQKLLVKGVILAMKRECKKKKMVRENECSSYPRFELMSDFYKKVLRNVQGTAVNISR